MSILFKPTSPELAHAAIFRGVYTKVARELGVTPQHVRRVDLKLSTSKRVSAAIDAEVKRRKREIGEVAA